MFGWLYFLYDISIRRRSTISMLLLLVIFPFLTSAQNFYGPSQLDQYARLINSGNLGGFGWYQDALNKGVVKDINDIDGSPRLQGLPPLPLTHDEVLHQLTSTPVPTTLAPTARPTTATTMAVPKGIYAVNSAPEMPPMPEERINGKFDEDGVFHPAVEDTKIKRNQIQGTKIVEFPDKADQPQEDYAADDFYDEPSLRVYAVKRVARQHQNVDRAVHHRYINDDIHPRQVQPRIIRQPPQPKVAAPLAPQYPPFVFQPKAPAVGREQVLTNLLTEVEEYDDFLEQHRVYKEQYPSSKPVLNPYRLLPEGQLPTLPRPIQYQPQSSSQSAQAPQYWINNGAASQPQSSPAATTATEHPLLSIFNLFRVPQAHAAPTLNTEFPLVDINQRPLPIVNPLAGIFSSRH